jgi:hypothetical protein
MRTSQERKTSTVPQRLTRHEAAEFLGVRYQTLAVWALRGDPKLPFTKIGFKAMYDLDDLREFVASRTVTSTAEFAAR